jgi:hypothetical protein
MWHKPRQVEDRSLRYLQREVEDRSLRYLQREVEDRSLRYLQREVEDRSLRIVSSELSEGPVAFNLSQDSRNLVLLGPDVHHRRMRLDAPLPLDEACVKSSQVLS